MFKISLLLCCSLLIGTQQAATTEDPISPTVHQIISAHTYNHISSAYRLLSRFGYDLIFPQQEDRQSNVTIVELDDNVAQINTTPLQAIQAADAIFPDAICLHDATPEELQSLLQDPVETSVPTQQVVTITASKPSKLLQALKQYAANTRRQSAKTTALSLMREEPENSSCDKDAAGGTALHFILISGDRDLFVPYLTTISAINRYSVINDVANNGKTPLMLAAQANDQYFVRDLLANNADANRALPDGSMAIELTTDTKIMEQLLQFTRKSHIPALIKRAGQRNNKKLLAVLAPYADRAVTTEESTLHAYTRATANALTTAGQLAYAALTYVNWPAAVRR